MTHDDQPLRGPLSGITVIDLSRALAGPYATMMLADAGADVIKVEQPGHGDDSRGWGPPFLDGPGADSTYFLSANRSKRSIALDLKVADERQTLVELIERADVLVENFRPGVMERLGLAPSVLADVNDRLVVLSISGYGEGGPDGDNAAFDQILQGEAGLMSINGMPDGPPMRFGLPITDILAGMFGAYGVVSALFERRESGRGQRVTTSLLAAALGVHTFQGTLWTVGGRVPDRTGNRHPTIAPYGAFRCSDGYVNIAVGTDAMWEPFARLIGMDQADPHYSSNSARTANIDDLEKEVNQRLSQWSVHECVNRLRAAGIAVGPIRTIDQVYDWEQVHHLGLVDEVEHPTAGAIRLPGPPVGWSRSGRARPRVPPRLGEHGPEVVEWLGRAAPTTSAREKPHVEG